MNRAENNRFKPSGLVNWVTVWGLIFAAIGLNYYADFKKEYTGKQTYQTALRERERELESLRIARQQMDQELVQMRSALDQCRTGQTAQRQTASAALVSNQ